jgi:hypothetical protein
VHFGGASEEGEAVGMRYRKIGRMGGPREFATRAFYFGEKKPSAVERCCRGGEQQVAPLQRESTREM